MELLNYSIMRKLFILAAAMISTAAVSAKTIYLNTGGNSLWAADGATFGIHAWGGGVTLIDAMMTEVSSNVYKAEINDAHTSIIYVRMKNGTTTFNWDNKWNQTGDLTISAGNDLYTITGWGANDGKWSKYDAGSGGGGEGGGEGGGGSDPEQDATKWYLKGTFNNWKAVTELTTKEGGEANTLYATLLLDAGKEYEFKMNKAGDWYGNAGIMTQAHHNNWLFSASMASNGRLATNIAGNYEFAFNTESKIVSVTYPDNPKQATLYETAVPENNPDVMLQAFYWAHQGTSSTPYTEFGNVNWSDLIAEAGDLAKYFSLVWLAPSHETADYTGYLPMNYSNQGVAIDQEGHHGHSPWGTSAELRTLIDQLHAGGAKVIADIVLNHTSAGHVDEYTGSDKNWCSWTANDFGPYGTFTPDWSWITAEDEMYATDKQAGRIDKTVTGDCGAHGASASLVADESAYSYKSDQQNWAYSEYNSTYSRDLAHNKKEVREMSRAYLTWMRDSMQYDGFRWDFMKGFHGSHLYDYNRTAAPYFSVAEVFEGDIDKQLGFLKDTKYSTYIFDFPGKFTIYNEAIRPYALKNLKGNQYTLLFGSNKRFAVSFIDNHDSFHESSSMSGEPNKIDDRQARMALAYLLSMPGVPCVAYPYWNNYKAECKAFIEARKQAGVHSMSEVENDWAGSGSMGDNYYEALIKGTKGYLFLKLGYDCDPTTAPSVNSPDGNPWQLAWANREHAGVWYTTTPEVPTTIENVGQSATVTKFMRNGVLYIRRGEAVYNLQGIRVQ